MVFNIDVTALRFLPDALATAVRTQLIRQFWLVALKTRRTAARRHLRSSAVTGLAPGSPRFDQAAQHVGPGGELALV